MMKKLLIFFSFLIASQAYDELVSALKNSEFVGYAKVMYVHDDRKGVKLDQSTLGVGGKIGLESGDWQGWRMNVAYYHTDDLGTRRSNPKQTDAYMFDVDKTPYGVLGEANIEYKMGKSVWRLGRQVLDTPLISTYDYRIIPNLFEAYTWINNDIKDITWTLSYVRKMSGLDGLVSFKNFESMSEQTYTSLMLDETHHIDTSAETLNVSHVSSHQGVIMAGLVIEKTPFVQLWNYYCPDVVNQVYMDMSYPYSLATHLLLTLEAQGYVVQGQGRYRDFLSSLGLNSSYRLYGIKTSLNDKNRGIKLFLAYNKFTGDDKTVTLFGNWGGYPEYVSSPYLFAENNHASAIAKSQMGKIGFSYDLASWGRHGDSLWSSYTLIDNHEEIMPKSDISVTSLGYKTKITPQFLAKIGYDIRHSSNYRYDNDILTFSLRYDF